MSFLRTLMLVGIALCFSACGGEEGASGGTPDEPYTNFFKPVTGESVYPESNPYSPEKEHLGELLFWDPILSGEMTIACASCHHPRHGWADGRDFSIGVDGVGLGPDRIGFETTDFHSPSIINAAFAGLELNQGDAGFVSGPYFWDSRAETLEDQALGPIQNSVEMRGFIIEESEIFDVIISRLAENEEYRMLFEAAFAEENPITPENIAAALATFQRKIVTQPTRFDAFLEGDDTALTGREITGLNKFINGGCARCHSGPMLSDYTIHLDEPVLRGKDAVRTQPLRNVELTAPYMHDGSKRSLRSAIAEYEDRGDLDVTLEDDDFGHIEAFLKTLTDPNVDQNIPASVPSGLPVGGDIDL